MSGSLSLQDSRVSHIDLVDGRATVYFSVVYIHGSKAAPGKGAGAGWTQEAELVLNEAMLSGALPPLPNTISAGFLEVGGVKHELIPLPFRRKVGVTLYLTFTDGTEIEILGQRPFIELLGQPIRLEDFS